MARAKYVDGFVLVVPKSKLALYKKMAKQGYKAWMKFGALDYHECVADDMNVPMGLPFPKLTKAKANEVVIFSWITYKSKADRNKINKKVHEFFSGKPMPDMPFDMKRLSYGGFKVLVN